jgi:hypothetical protein
MTLYIQFKINVSLPLSGLKSKQESSACFLLRAGYLLDLFFDPEGSF